MRPYLLQKICNIIVQKWGVVGSKAVWNFSKNSSSLVSRSFPKTKICQSIQSRWGPFLFTHIWHFGDWNALVWKHVSWNNKDQPPKSEIAPPSSPSKIDRGQLQLYPPSSPLQLKPHSPSGRPTTNQNRSFILLIFFELPWVAVSTRSWHLEVLAAR